MAERRTTDTDMERMNTLISTTKVKEGPVISEEPIFYLEKYERLEKALRVTAFIQRFLKGCRTREKIMGPIDVKEVEEAEMYWIKYTQRNSFLEEIRS